MYLLNWFLYKHIRQATDMKRQVKMLLNEQRDLLNPTQIAKIESAIASMRAVLGATSDKKKIADEMASLEKIANDNLKPYPAATIRENVKEILVAIATIMAFTSFFLQLTKIPTGSMQPTLYGITDENLLDQNPGEKIPGFLGRVKDYWVWGIQYNYFVAPVDGEFQSSAPVQTVFPFIKKQKFKFAGQTHTLWFPGDSLFAPGDSSQRSRAVIRSGMVKKGDYVFAMKVIAGDHLLVDRFTYNFRRPNRGEIIVFKTRGIEGLPQDQLYIKRLVGLSGERVQVGNDRRLIIDGRRLSASDRHFEMVYSIDDSKDPLVAALKSNNPEEVSNAYYLSHRNPPYRGHVNGRAAAEIYRHDPSLAPLFPDEQAAFQISTNGYMAMGDNTLNSLDSRAWGDFDRKNLIGKCWFIYWPFTDRFGWGYR